MNENIRWQTNIEAITQEIGKRNERKAPTTKIMSDGICIRH